MSFDETDASVAAAAVQHDARQARAGTPFSGAPSRCNAVRAARCAASNVSANACTGMSSPNAKKAANMARMGAAAKPRRARLALCWRRCARLRFEEFHMTIHTPHRTRRRRFRASRLQSAAPPPAPEMSRIERTRGGHRRRAKRNAHVFAAAPGSGSAADRATAYQFRSRPLDRTRADDGVRRRSGAGCEHRVTLRVHAAI